MSDRSPGTGAVRVRFGWDDERRWHICSAPTNLSKVDVRAGVIHSLARSAEIARIAQPPVQ